MVGNAWGLVTHHVYNPTQFQAALTAAEDNDDDDLIIVHAGNYNIDTDLSSTPLSFFSNENHTLTIQGEGSDSTILDGENGCKIMQLDTTAASDDAAHITISGLTFQNGST
jgi:hypothetical protein